MRKADLIKEVTLLTGNDKDSTEHVIETTLKVIADSLINGKPLYIRNFGTFNIVKRRLKTGRNITKGTSVVIPSHYTPVFKFSKIIKSKVKSNVKDIE